eukprot:TRINITY_DN7342_c1_g1_i2.p2 TRINITY_DN7342_c1_g1~~TRINITY_DN7342_c1_g1_i2.p2  ORF type:complete len:101 (+),score=7.38 TRINITY_DN7342_c1_g1_i2:3202-3504(+)
MQACMPAESGHQDTSDERLTVSGLTRTPKARCTDNIEDTSSSQVRRAPACTSVAAAQRMKQDIVSPRSFAHSVYGKNISFGTLTCWPATASTEAKNRSYS